MGSLKYGSHNLNLILSPSRTIPGVGIPSISDLPPYGRNPINPSSPSVSSNPIGLRIASGDHIGITYLWIRWIDRGHTEHSRDIGIVD
jgi:hypothetical protein